MSGLRRWNDLRLLLGRPRLLGRVAVNYARMSIGTHRLRSLDVDLTYRCPCKCEQCYADDYLVAEPDVLTVDEIADCVQQAVALGAIHVSLSGGEPLVRKDLESIVSNCRAMGTLVSMCSSGAGLTASRLDRLIRAGLSVAIFSLDSVEAERHDRNRGIPGLYERILRNIDRGRQGGLRVIVNTVATAEKLDSGELEDLLRVVRRQGAVLNLTIPTPCGRWDGMDNVMLSADHRRRLRRFLETPGVRTDTHSTYWGTGCPAANEKLAIGAYGDVRACQMIPFAFGNVRRATLAEIWAELKDGPIGRNRQWFCPAGDPVFRQAHPSYFDPALASPEPSVVPDTAAPDDRSSR